MVDFFVPALAYSLLVISIASIGCLLLGLTGKILIPRTIRIALLWLAAVSLFAASRFTFLRPLLFGPILILAALAVGYSTNLIRTPYQGLITVILAVAIWLCLFLFWPQWLL